MFLSNDYLSDKLLDKFWFEQYASTSCWLSHKWLKKKFKFWGKPSNESAQGFEQAPWTIVSRFLTVLESYYYIYFTSIFNFSKIINA